MVALKSLLLSSLALAAATTAAPTSNILTSRAAPLGNPTGNETVELFLADGPYFCYVWNAVCEGYVDQIVKPGFEANYGCGTGKNATGEEDMAATFCSYTDNANVTTSLTVDIVKFGGFVRVDY